MLFSSFKIGSITLANRIVMAPLTRNRATASIPSDLMALYYQQRASAGLIISEATAITQQGQGYSDVPGLYQPAQIEAWKKITSAVHQAGGKIVVQLWHVGRVSHTDLQPKNQAPVAPSAIAANAKTYLIKEGVGAFYDTSMPRALELDELPGIVQDYRNAARNAIAAGFDGVEIHAANGYLLDQFLKTASNHRSDEYGSSIENRARLTLEVTQAVVAEIGADKTGIRLSPVSPANDSFDAQPQALFDYLLTQLAPLNLAYIHVIEGATGGPREISDRPFDYDALKNSYRKAGGNAAWMVNNGYDRASAEQALINGNDLVAFGRPFISNPDLVERLRTGAAQNPIPDRADMYGGGAKNYTDFPTLTT